MSNLVCFENSSQLLNPNEPDSGGDTRPQPNFHNDIDSKTGCKITLADKHPYYVRQGQHIRSPHECLGRRRNAYRNIKRAQNNDTMNILHWQVIM